MRAWPLARGGGLRQLATVLEHVRYEVLPTQSAVDAVAETVPKDVTITVTASPRKGIEPTLEVAEQIAGLGYHAVPHVSARLLRDGSHLREVADRLATAGITDIFMPGGDADPPAGAYDAALPALIDLSSLEHRFRVGITGYPESHPRITDDLTIQAMWDKRKYADYIVSNLCFDAGVLRDWIRRVRARGVALPLYVGIAGPVDPTKLLDVARKIGVGESTRFAGGHLGWVAKFSRPGGYSPDRLLTRIGPTLADPASAVEGLHIFTFNQVGPTETWRRRLLASSSA